MTTSVSRRSFLKWGAAAGACAIGLSACDDELEPEPVVPDDTDEEVPVLVESGKWLTGACYSNCNCGSGRCLVRVYVEDGIPIKTRSDEDELDTYARPQHRACPRGRSRMSEATSPARIKYPMKRKTWSLDDPHGENRGKDEWVRISWDEALDLVAQGIRKNNDAYGPMGTLLAGVSGNGGDGYFDQCMFLYYVLGGGVLHQAGTISYGSWSVVDSHMLGGWGYTLVPGHLQFITSDLHVMFGYNWAVNKAGNHAWFVKQARERGQKIIVIDPWMNQTTVATADEWIPVIPGTDTVLMQAICFEWIKAGTFDKAFLDKYCIGFDEDTMPEDQKGKNRSWKAYITGEGYDKVEKTPEWAEAICGVPAAKIRELAAEIAGVDKVDFFCGQSVSKIPAGEQLAQTFYSMCLMHGGIGTPGHYMHWNGMQDAMGGNVAPGNYCPPAANPANPLAVAGAPRFMMYPIPQWAALKDPDAWLNLEPSECWRVLLSGEYGRDCWPTGKRKVNMHSIYFGGCVNSLNQLPDVNDGIKAVRKMDFVWGSGPFFDTSRQYCDVVLPTTHWWEKSNKAFAGDGACVMWFDRIMEAPFEAKNESWIAEQLATRLGIDPLIINKLNEDERCYATVRDATLTDGRTFEKKPLLTITAQEIAEFFPTAPDAAPQEGVYTFAELREKGIIKNPLEDDMLPAEPFAAFIADPEGHPLSTESGKFEIYSRTLAASINSVGYSTIEPIGVYQVGDPEQGAGQQTAQYPLLLWTPHSLRGGHSVFQSVRSLREAFPQECWMSRIDADARGIKNGDTVLLTSPYGKMLRHAKVVDYIVPGAVAIQDGSWFEIDEATGIDLGGCPNVLQAPKASGGGCQAWTGTLLQVAKYNGPLTLEADKDRPLVMPVGIEA